MIPLLAGYLLGGKWLLNKGKAAISRACCCDFVPCTCASIGAASGRILTLTVVAADPCGICTDPPTDVFGPFPAAGAADGDCCVWNFSGGSGQAADCGPPATRGFGFQLRLCQVEGIWRFMIRSIPGLDYCRPDDCFLPTPNICTTDSFSLTANRPGTIHTCNGPCATSYDITITG